jgi:hypothetical protein
MSRTTSLDDDQLLVPEVLVKHHRPDFEVLAEEVGGRAVKELSGNPAGCLYLKTRPGGSLLAQAASPARVRVYRPDVQSAAIRLQSHRGGRSTTPTSSSGRGQAIDSISPKSRQQSGQGCGKKQTRKTKPPIGS